MSNLTKPIDFTLSAHFEKSSSGEDGPLRIRGFANTTTKDRAGDVIPRSAWEGKNALPNYLKNPIILAQHDHSQPIGKMVDYTISDEGLEIEAEISKSVKEYGLINDGVLKSFSVGFRLLDAEYKSDADIFLIKELELLEISVVSVPCNQDSTFELAKSMSDSDYNNLKKQLLVGASVNNDNDTSEDWEQELFKSVCETKEDVLEKLASALGII
jgi:HK97 family phage prohead protease